MPTAEMRGYAEDEGQGMDPEMKNCLLYNKRKSFRLIYNDVKTISCYN